MLESCDMSKLGKIYNESVGLGPEGESTVGLGSPVMTQLKTDDKPEERIVGKVVLWKNSPWLVVGQQGTNVSLIMLSNNEATAPKSDVTVTPSQPE